MLEIQEFPRSTMVRGDSIAVFGAYADFSYKPLVILPSDSNESIYVSGHKPVPGRSHFAGDRPCYHENFHGNLRTIPWEGYMVEGVDGQDLPRWYYYTSEGSLFVYSPIPALFPGEDYFLDWVELDPTTSRCDWSRVKISITWDMTDEAHPILILESWLSYEWYGARSSHAVQAQKFDISNPRHIMADSSYDGVIYDFLEVNQNISSLDITPDLSCVIPPKKIDWLFHLLRLTRPLPTEYQWGSLCQTAIQDAKRIDVNTPVLIREILFAHEAVFSVADLLHGDFSAKNVANAFLLFKYGPRLTWKDMNESIDALAKASVEIPPISPYTYLRARESYPFVHKSWPLQNVEAEMELHYKIYYDPVCSPLSDLRRKLKNWDIYPEFGNLWDMVPYSFVLDWFVDVGSMLESLDAANYANDLNVLGVTKSCKITYNPPASFWSSWFFGNPNLLQGEASIVIYDRSCDSQLVKPRPRLETTFEAPNHVAELSSLIVQRL